MEKIWYSLNTPSSPSSNFCADRGEKFLSGVGLKVGIDEGSQSPGNGSQNNVTRKEWETTPGIPDKEFRRNGISDRFQRPSRKQWVYHQKGINLKTNVPWHGCICRKCILIIFCKGWRTHGRRRRRKQGMRAMKDLQLLTGLSLQPFKLDVYEINRSPCKI